MGDRETIYDLGVASRVFSNSSQVRSFDLPYDPDNLNEPFEFDDRSSRLDQYNYATRCQLAAFDQAWDRLSYPTKRFLRSSVRGFKFSSIEKNDIENGRLALYGKNHIVYNAEDRYFYIAVPCVAKRSFMNMVVNIFTNQQYDMAECWLLEEDVLTEHLEYVAEKMKRGLVDE